MSEDAFERWILALATLVCRDEAEARRWFRREAIAGLEGRTAHELVRAGRGGLVLDFLLDILRSEMPAQGGMARRAR